MGRVKDYNSYYRTSISIQSLLKWRYHLPESTLISGTNYQKQNDSWDCGPNSAGRALQMWSKIKMDFNDYNKFKSNCPKLIGMPQTTGGKVKLGFFHFLTLGLSTIVTSICEAACPVGPAPGDLAKYITNSIKQEGKGIHSHNELFDSALNKIKDDIKNGDPVIVLIAWAPTRMHYINVVGVSDQDDVAVIDTDNELYYYSRSDFEDLMDCSSYTPHKCCLANYNLIRFEKS